MSLKYKSVNKIKVIIPVYNAEDEIYNILTSIVSYYKREADLIIVIDPETNDNSRQEISRFAKDTLGLRKPGKDEVIWKWVIMINEPEHLLSPDEIKEDVDPHENRIDRLIKRGKTIAPTSTLQHRLQTEVLKPELKLVRVLYKRDGQKKQLPSE